MESNTISVSSGSNQAPDDNTLGTGADPPAIEPLTRPPAAAGLTAAETSTDATNSPETTVEETVQANKVNQPTVGPPVAPAPNLKPPGEKYEHVTGFTSPDESSSDDDTPTSNAPRLLRSVNKDPDEETDGPPAAPAPNLKPPGKKYEHVSGFTSSDESSSDDDTSTSNAPRLLRSVDKDPDEETDAPKARFLNWRWPAYEEVIDRSGNVFYAKRGKAPKAPSTGFPFQIVYPNTRNVVLWPDAAIIKLKSPNLLAICGKCLPDETDLQYRQTVNVDGRRMYVVLDKLKQHLLRSHAECAPSTISPDLTPTKHGSSSQNGHHGVSVGVSQGFSDENQNDRNGVSKTNANLAAESLEIRSHDLAPPSSGSQGAAREAVEEGWMHLYYLVIFLEDEYSVVALRKQHLKEDKSVTFDMLWAFLTPGTTVVYYCSYTQEQLCAKVLDNCYQQTQSGKIFKVTLDVWDYNGVAYRQCTVTQSIGQFGGEKPFDTLAVFPIDMGLTMSAEALKGKFLARGRQFRELAMLSSNRFCQYIGPIHHIRQDKLVKAKADGRVMVDLKSFAVMNTNYPMHNAQPPASSAANDLDSAGFPVTAANRVRMMPARRANPKQHRTNVAMIDEAAQAVVGLAASQEVEDENLIFAPAVVYGFSFALKLWGAFAVSGFSEIDFDTSAFDALVMDPERKGLIYSIVSQFVATRTSSSGPSGSSPVKDLPRVDPIANKGEGCIFFCYGPPGTGKTLTAESLAESLRRPLWSLSVAELGITPADVEKTLLKILDVAAMWKAVLLLDEADIYLEKRVVSTDLTHNAMTVVFLRHLEYYKGVLFLTTNRVITTIDDAFLSRISLMVYYPQLDQKRREQIWNTALARVQAGKREGVKLRRQSLADLASKSFNGREIRNTIHIAQTLARSKDEELQEKHLWRAISVMNYINF